MRRVLLLVLSILVSACGAPPPTPVATPSTPPPPPPAPLEEQVSGTVRVTATALNVRQSPSADAGVIAQVKRGTELVMLRGDESWVHVRLADGQTGWVAARFVEDAGARSLVTKPAKRASPRRGGCPPDSDYAFLEMPTPSFSDDGAHGLVVVEANVNAKGIVTSTKLISNGTGSETLGFLAEREIKSAKFSVPIRNCVARAFIFTYRRTF
jgi:hypothetical protein